MYWFGHAQLLSVFGALLLASRPVHAETDVAPVDVYEYSTPTKKNYLRAFLELEALTAVGAIWYVIDVNQGHGLDYRWQSFRRKLTFASAGHDDNAFSTNYKGHGMGGNAYYLSARSNHLDIGESFGFAVAGAVLWEFFGEVDQAVSVNDLIYTPFSGIGIGEPVSQLAAFFDRQRPTFLNRAFGTLFGPIKSLNDRLDGVTLSRNANPRDDWHRFSFATGAVFTRIEISDPGRSVAEHSEFRLELSERLARLRGYDSEATVAGFYDDGNVSAMSLVAAFGGSGLRDLDFRAEVSPFGYYQRNVRPIAGGLLGNALLVGFQLGYRYLAHDYGATTDTGLNQTVFVQPISGLFEYKGELGKLSLTSRLAISGLYGGTHPLASRAYGSERSALAPVLQKFDYYFGAGAQLETSLTVRVLSLEAEFNLLGRSMRCVDEHVRIPIRDRWQRLQLGIGFRPRFDWLFRVYADDSLRTGQMATARSSAHEHATGLEARVNF